MFHEVIPGWGPPGVEMQWQTVVFAGPVSAQAIPASLF